MNQQATDVTVLGLGAMGSALASTLLAHGQTVTVWNRTAGRSEALVQKGGRATTHLRDAVTASPLVVVCLFDHDSVHEALDPVVNALAGRALVNVTTTTPEQARSIAGWAARHEIAYLDGGVMAIPAMIGSSSATIFYSGSESVFGKYRALLDRWGTSTYFGNDAGLASLWDLSMLAAMYVMFGGFFQGAAMVAAAGVKATDFAAAATPFLAAMTGAFPRFARIVDARDYGSSDQQSLEFSDLAKILQTSTEAGAPTDILAPVQALIRHGIDSGHGKEGFARIFEGLRPSGARS